MVNISSKQAIRNKPIRFGYKVWCQNNPSGYLVSFDSYQGKTFEANVEEEENFEKCSATILHLLRNYSSDKIDLSYVFYCDNLFTTLPLAHELLQRDYNSVGFIRQNRMGKKCLLKDVKTVSKENRGAYDGAKARFKGKEIFVTQWKDNAVFTLASSLYGVEPLGTKKRWSKTERKHIYIDTPFVVCQYNKNMGGTDRMDQTINAYPVSIRGKKWWWCLFTWLLDVSITNVWILFQAKGEALPQIDFRRAIVHSYSNISETRRKE